MTVKTLLDDAAAHATADRQINLPLVLERAETQRLHRARVVWLRGGVAFLAVAAVVALIAVLLPSGSLLRGEGIPASQPDPVPAETGIPATWFYAPVWTPPVTRHPMAAAVMVLSAPLRNATSDYSWRGPVLVSADAKTYATLPNWGENDGGVALSADGRQVAWWTWGRGGERLTRIVVHMLTLANGRSRDVTMSPGVPDSMTWHAGRIYVQLSPSDLDASASSQSWMIDPSTGSATPADCPCYANLKEVLTDRLGPSGDITATGFVLDPAQRSAVWTSFDQPAGQRSRYVLHSAGVSGTAPGGHVIEAGERVIRAEVLAWTRAGIFLQISTQASTGAPIHRSIRLMNPQTREMTVISRPYGTVDVYPAAVASGLAQTGTPIAAPRPVISGWDRAHLAYLAGHHRPELVLAGGLMFAVIAGALAAWWVRRRHRPVS